MMGLPFQPFFEHFAATNVVLERFKACGLIQPMACIIGFIGTKVAEMNFRRAVVPLIHQEIGEGTPYGERLLQALIKRTVKLCRLVEAPARLLREGQRVERLRDAGVVLGVFVIAAFVSYARWGAARTRVRPAGVLDVTESKLDKGDTEVKPFDSGDGEGSDAGKSPR